MAWCPFALHRPLSENHLQGRITPRAIVLHTAVSSSPSLYDFFQNRSDLESHFYVRNDGTIEQYMDTGIRADANKNANDFAVSIETQDGGQIVPWTDAQVNALVRLCNWLCDMHAIPRRQIPAAYDAGIGWHVMFGAPGPWTPVAKSCPGGPRIQQARDVIIPRVAARQLTVESNDMTPEEHEWLRQTVTVLGEGFPPSIGRRVSDQAAKLAAVDTKLASVATKDELATVRSELASLRTDLTEFLVAAVQEHLSSHPPVVTVDYAEIARVVNDDQARRQAS